MNIKTDTIFTLNHRVAFYVPSTQGLTGKISRQTHRGRTAEVARILTEELGGATAYRAQGYYKSRGGELVTEAVEIVIAFTDDKTLERGSQTILQLAQDKAREWGQESILVEIDNKALFIEG